MDAFDFKCELDHFRSLGYTTENFDDMPEDTERIINYWAYLPDRLKTIRLLKTSRLHLISWDIPRIRYN